MHQLQAGLDPFISFLIFKFKFKLIDFEKTKFKFIDFKKKLIQIQIHWLCKSRIQIRQ